MTRLGAATNAKMIVALLGRKDGVTDGVADYCTSLGRAMEAYGYEFVIVRSDWPEAGWRAALADLRKKAEAWRGSWVLLQFTALGWSRRGFPLHVPRILAILREHGVRCGVVFHEFMPPAGHRLIDRARQFCQQRVLRQIYDLVDCAVFTVPLDMVSWIPARRDKAVSIPIGANCPEPPVGAQSASREVKTIAVYSVTGGAHILPEVRDIGHAVKRASQAVGPLRLVVLGRGSQEADSTLRAEFAGANVKLETLGLLPPEEVSRVLAGSDVLLFVRRELSSRRSTAIAGIACGLPIVCYAGPETAWPVTEAGILSVPLDDREALAAALGRVLSDGALRISLAERSRLAQQKYFSWPVIAAQFAAALRGPCQESSGGMMVETPGKLRSSRELGSY